MRSSIVLLLALGGLAFAQGIPPAGGGTPGATPAPAALDPNLGWYRLTYQRQPVGFVREEWREEQVSGRNCLHMLSEGQFVAKPDLLRDLPYTDFKAEVICDAQTQDLQWASFTLSFPVQLAPGAGASDFKLVQGLVRFMVDRREVDGKTYLRFTSSDEEFQDAQLPLSPGDVFVFPDAIPRMLTGQLRPGKTFEKRSILLSPGLGSGRDAGRYVASLTVQVKEETKVKIGDDEEMLFPVLITMPSPEGVPATRVTLMDNKGIIRKSWITYLDPAKITEFGDEPQDTVVYTRVASELEAREGLAFVLSSRGRRDPFVDPRTPAIKSDKNIKDIASKSEGPVTPESQAPTATVTMKIEDAQEMVRAAERLFADIQKIVNLGSQATPAQEKDREKFVEELYKINGQIQGTKFVALKSQMSDMVVQVEKLLKSKGDRYVNEARAVFKRVEELFNNQEISPRIRVSEIGQQVDKLKGLSGTPGLPPPGQAEIQRLLQESVIFHRRAQKLADFEEKKPDITGVVVHSEAVLAPLKLGLVLFGRPIVIDTEIPLPRSKSQVILSVKGVKTGHRAYEEGQMVEGISNLKVKRIERNRVTFEYDQELITVSTAR